MNFFFTELPSSYQSKSAQINITKSSNDKMKNASRDDKIEILPGCEIVERRCQCWQSTISVCRESSVTKWDFANAEVNIWHFLDLFFLLVFPSQECELNLQNLIKQELEFDEDFTIPPGNFNKFSKLKKRRKNSKRVRKSQKVLNNFWLENFHRLHQWLTIKFPDDKHPNFTLNQKLQK